MPKLKNLNLKKLFLIVIAFFAGIFLIASLSLALYVVNTEPPPLWEGLSYSPIILDTDGKLMRMGLSKDDKYRLRARLDQIPVHARNAVLLYEDRYYYKHPGVNPLAILRAMGNMLSGSRRMGASTIAMQVARLRYGIMTRSIKGKLTQMLRALQLIYHHGHDDVLEAYFTLAPYGGNIEGIGAATRIYFRHSVQMLSPSQALTLSLIPQNPQARAFKSGKYGRLILPPKLEYVRNTLHANWNALYPEIPVPQKAPPLRISTVKELPRIAPHITTDFLQEVKNSLDEQHTIYSTIDSKHQLLIESSINRFLAQHASFNLHNATAMLVHWPSMQVSALAGSANFNNVNIDGQVDGTKARRSPGSTLKPFIYALALEQGLIHSQTVLLDTPKNFGEYNPENFDKQFQGPLSAADALRLSRNMPAIWLASRLDPSLYTFMQRSHMNLAEQVEHYGLSLVLGGAEVRMRDLVAMYAMLANGGVWQDLVYSKKVNSLENNMLSVTNKHYGPKLRESSALISAEAALVAAYMIEVPQYNVGHVHKSFPFRYKTGTSNGLRDAWAIGIIGPYVLAVWLGNFDNSANPMLVGSKVATPLFMQIARSLIREEQLTDLLANKYKETKLIHLEVCRDTGDVQTDLCAEKTYSWFIPGRSPVKNSGVYRKIWIDPKTNLRLCGPSPEGKEVVWEFWPSQLYQLFSQAGLHKPLPPAFAEPCPDFIAEPWEQNTINIQSPQQNVTYHFSTMAENKLNFSATSTAHAKTLFWFVNEE